jgi:hypothetical protein
MTGFIKAMRTEEADFLDNHPIANHVLNVIARRARRTPCKLNKLEIGECFIGHKGLGITERQYRTAKKQLSEWTLVEFKKGRKATDKGTVAKLLDSRVYDINATEDDGRETEERRKRDAKETTNKECNKGNNEEDNGLIPPEEKKPSLNYDKIKDIFNTTLTNASNVVKLTDKRKKLVKKLFDGFELDYEKFESYLAYMNTHPQCQWMFEKRMKTDGSGQYWSAKTFDYFVDEKCFLNVKENY